MNYSDGQLIDQYIKLRDKKAAIVEQTKPVSEAMNTIEAELLKRMLATNAQSIKAESGAIAYRSTLMQARVTDRTTFQSFIQENPSAAEQLLTNAVSKEGVKAFMETNSDSPPPGIEITNIVGVNFRKG